MSVRIGNKVVANYTEPVDSATSTTEGKIRIATDAEVTAGVSTTTAVTPAQLANAATRTQVDDTTIEKDANDVITTMGMKTKSGTYMYDWVGTLEQYNAAVSAGTIQSNWVCWITDDEEDVEQEIAKAVEKLIAEKANIAWYPDKEIRYLQPDYIQGDKTTIKIKAGTRIAINGTTYKWDTDTSYTVANILDTGSITNGKDYCIYLTEAGTIVVSANSTYPTGYSASNTKKIGGFHTLCVAVTSGNAPALAGNSFWSSHPAIGYAAGNIIPNSVWTTAHRPYSDPSGMVYIKPSWGEKPFWVDIYLQSGTFTTTKSVYNGTLTNSRNPILHQYDMLLNNKKLATDNQFMIFAEGSNQKTNIAGSALPSPARTGGHLDTASKRMISGFFVEECCGYVWQWLDEISPSGGSGWADYSDTSRGGSYGMPYVLVAGGRYGASTHCGSWSRASNSTRSCVGADRGARGVSFPVPYVVAQ